ncbi:hypothetical protein F0U62_25520 [Cystobacter fuscus]|uniref:hypothetical protein n=1 Tax=Cystobacter fuscus TaxID=43 RepID=UPI002B303344|nr:hypothetical protein F0U62_25520 [Cystobacter fuscus]
MRQSLVVLFLFGLLVSPRAEAYTWMIRHGYSSCAACHADPSGAGLVTAYGRAQSELLLAANYGKAKEEVSPSTGFLFGAVNTPDWLLLGLSFRGGALVNQAGSADPTVRPVQMASDIRAQATFGQFRANASLGFALRRARLAALTTTEANNVVSRDHWLGWDNENQTLLVRAGRINLPFGLRNVEHTSWVRERTRTDTNEHQQYGLAVAYNGEGFRGELMGIAGNFLLKPDEYRERGYSGYFEWSPKTNLALGVSSLATRAAYDVDSRQPDSWRQAHGVFGRWAVNGPVVLLGEVDLLVNSSRDQSAGLGYTGLLQADIEPVQGLHVIVSGETLRTVGGVGTNVGGSLGLAFSFLPQVELRVDGVVRRFATETGGTNTLSILSQLHLLL